MDKIITEMCIFEVTDGGLLLTELNHEYTVDDVVDATQATSR